MTETIVANEPTIRLAIFFGVFLAVALCEALFPRRQRAISRSLRWPSNIAAVVLNTALLRLLSPASMVLLALAARDNGWGLLNQLALPGWVSVVVVMLMLDFAIYLQHVLFHAVPFLWRVHRMHHADLEFDVTTGVRFHPIEIGLSMAFKFVVVAALGPPVIAVLFFELLLNATSMFNHANVKIPVRAERMLRLLLVTPDMHRVHHSIVARETNSNFGFNLPWWDRLLGTYRTAPAAGHENMTIGVDQFRDPCELRLGRMLTQPFRGPSGYYPIHRNDVGR
jgi:sterol desaturase/sphingolipid hydroxylase (fatty acid hydroxylase superfamily)